jgi:hypothetical protein
LTVALAQCRKVELACRSQAQIVGAEPFEPIELARCPAFGALDPMAGQNPDFLDCGNRG